MVTDLTMDIGVLFLVNAIKMCIRDRSRDELIPLETFKMFKEEQNFSVASVKRFAKENRIAPGIVVGRLQNEGCIEYNMLNLSLIHI